MAYDYRYINCDGNSTSFEKNGNLRVYYSYDNGVITLLNLAGMRTDGYHTWNASDKTIYVAVYPEGTNPDDYKKQLSLGHCVDFGASSSYQDWNPDSASWSFPSGANNLVFKLYPLDNVSGTQAYNGKSFTLSAEEGYISVPPAAPTNVSINPVASGRTSINLQRNWQNATVCEYNVNNWGWISEDTSYQNGVHVSGNNVTNLDPNTTYNLQIRMRNGSSDWVYSDAKSCTTSGNNPVINTITTIPTAFGCTFSADITYDDNDSFGSVRIDYGTTSSYGSTSNSWSIDNLSPETVYYYKVTVTSAKGYTSVATGIFTTATDQAKARLKINGVWTIGKVFFKKNGAWVKPKKIFIKKNGSWIVTKNS